MSLTTFPTPTGHCVQITTAGIIEGRLRISGYGNTVQDAKIDAIEKLQKYIDDKKKRETQPYGKIFAIVSTEE